MDINKNYKSSCSNLLYIDDVSIDHCIEIIKSRYESKKIYTLLGSVLLSVNPYMNIYPTNPEKGSALETDIGLHTLIDKVIKNLHKKNQVIIISGESGSGKTESSKQIIKILETMSDDNMTTTNTTDTTSKSAFGVGNRDLSLLEKIQASGVLLEFFGNSCTIKNHNSSRFGKFIEVFYKKGTITGMKINTYLLEKVRVLTKDDKSKFHIFNKLDINNKLDILTKVGFSNEQIEFIYSIVSKVSNILGLTFIDKDKLDILVKTKIEIQDEQIEKVYNESEFNELRDTLAMKLYEKLFNWLVEQMNLMYEVKEYDYKIGILDIFGFEDLVDNSLEQLCINYANEIIQGLLNKVLIDDKIELYKSEGIDMNLCTDNIMSNIGNNDKIKLIQNIFTNLDEECILPKGNESALIYKMNKNYSNCSIYSTNKISINNKFTIEHFAGKIDYKIENFIKKNMDKANKDIEKYINETFSNKVKNTGISRNKVKINSITNQFCNSLNEFLEIIKDCDLHFIKCIKPNDNEKALYFNDNMVREQLVYNGIIQLINILKSGYSHNVGINEFDKIYTHLTSPVCPISHASRVVLAEVVSTEVVRGRTRVFYTESTHIKLCELLRKIREESIIVISTACKRYNINRAYNNKIRFSSTIINYVNMNNYHRTYIKNIYAYKIQQFIKYAIEKNRFNRLRSIMVLANRVKTLNICNKYRHTINNLIIIKNAILNNYNHKKYKQLINKVKVLQVRIKMHYNKKVRACIKIQLIWLKYNKMKKNVMVQNTILQKRNNYLENKVIELELKILKFRSYSCVDKGTMCSINAYEPMPKDTYNDCKQVSKNTSNACEPVDSSAYEPLTTYTTNACEPVDSSAYEPLTTYTTNACELITTYTSNAYKPVDSSAYEPLTTYTTNACELITTYTSNAYKPMDSSAYKPVDSSAYKPVDSSAYKPVDSSAYKPVDSSAYELIGDDDYVKIDLNNEDANIRIKKLEDDIKNIIDDRIKLLTIIDTITTENRNMYRYIKKNDKESWFSRLFR
jgi:myosin heavy subunit